MNDNSYLLFNDDCWNKVLTNITQSNYVLVVGHEVMLNPEKTGGFTDSNLYFEEMRRKRKRDDDDFSDKSRYDQILDLMREHEFNTDDMSAGLKELLKTKCFRLVLTTTRDHYVETLMREIWGDELQVLDIYGDKTTAFDLSDEILSDEYYDIKPTLYYVFGKADPDNEVKNFVVTDNDSIEAIAKWMNVNDNPKRLLNFMKKKELLAIGCKFEDWYFRFLWYALRGEVKNLKKGQVAISLNLEHEGGDASDIKLGHYLKEQKVYTYPDSNVFIGKLTEKLSGINSSVAMLRHQGGVFISYASEDSAMATLLFKKLVEQGFTVWLDSARLFAGNSYDNRIAEAIGSCKVFMPLLSSQVAKDVVSGNEERYYRKEWSLFAQNETGAVSFPVVLDGYEMRSDYHCQVESIVGRRTAFELKNRPISDLYEELKKTIGHAD